jgi:hypothetical protein
MNGGWGKAGVMDEGAVEGHTTLSTFAPASAAQASPCFCASFARPGISDFTLAEALDRSAAGLLAHAITYHILSSRFRDALRAYRWN